MCFVGGYHSFFYCILTGYDRGRESQTLLPMDYVATVYICGYNLDGSTEMTYVSVMQYVSVQIC